MSSQEGLWYLDLISLLIKSKFSAEQFVFKRAKGWTIGVLGFDSRRGLGISHFTTAFRMALEPTQPPIQLVPGALSLGVKWPGVKLPTHLHVVPWSKNEWSYTSTPQHALMAWCSLKNTGTLHLQYMFSPQSEGLLRPRYQSTYERMKRNGQFFLHCPPYTTAF
jgi:hypothetical protein